MVCRILFAPNFLIFRKSHVEDEDGENLHSKTVCFSSKRKPIKQPRQNIEKIYQGLQVRSN